MLSYFFSYFLILQTPPFFPTPENVSDNLSLRPWNFFIKDSKVDPFKTSKYSFKKGLLGNQPI